MSVNGLAELAKEGLSERLIRFMMAAGATAPPSVPLQEATMVAPATGKAPRAKSKTFVVKPSATRQAISSQTPYYKWTSIFWGLWKRRVGVGAMSRNEQVVAPSLGGFYQQVRVPVSSPPPARQFNPYDQVATRYVVLQ